MRWAALLRGVNLGKRQLKSADLKAAAESLGWTDVQPLLASGNVVFSAVESEPTRIEQALHHALAKSTGLKSDVFVRSADELAAVIAANPFPDVARDRPSQLLVAFHRDLVDPACLLRLAESFAGPERLHATGRELFIDFPNGQARSDLHKPMGKAGFAALTTARNWNTVTKVAAAL